MDFKDISSIILPRGEVKLIVDSSNEVIWEWKKLKCLISTGIQVVDTGVYCTSTWLTKKYHYDLNGNDFGYELA